MLRRRTLLVTLTSLVALGGGALAAPSPGSAVPPDAARPAAGLPATVQGYGAGVEDRKVARATVPRLRWGSCFDDAPQGLRRDVIDRLECATIKVPLDYDRPHGATTPLEVTRVTAAKPGRRIGSLFVNPGGPGGSAGGFTTFVGRALGRDVDARFDIVGVDPRGTGGSGRTVCRGPVRIPGGYVEFPRTPKQVRQTVAFDNGLRRACHTNASPLVDHASTADVARDMDLVRRALHESKLTYYGISYGSYLGQTYAAMFPEPGPRAGDRRRPRPDRLVGHVPGRYPPPVQLPPAQRPRRLRGPDRGVQRVRPGGSSAMPARTWVPGQVEPGPPCRRPGSPHRRRLPRDVPEHRGPRARRPLRPRVGLLHRRVRRRPRRTAVDARLGPASRRCRRLGAEPLRRAGRGA